MSGWEVLAIGIAAAAIGILGAIFVPSPTKITLGGVASLGLVIIFVPTNWVWVVGAIATIAGVLALFARELRLIVSPALLILGLGSLGVWAGITYGYL
jgi:hypothetical protein